LPLLKFQPSYIDTCAITGR